MRAVKRAAAALAVAAMGLTAVGCSETSEPAVATEVVTVTSGAEPEGSTSTGSSPATSSATPTGAVPGSAKALRESFAEFALTLPAPAGLSIVPVGGGDPINLGDQTAQVAWSTIKVPVALAAQRKNGPSPAATAAITASDNAAAEQLWASLGSDPEAAAAVTAILREGGDERTEVPSVRRRAGYTIFGQTVWPLSEAAVFTANLPCLPGSEQIVELMGQVQANQQWGIEIIPNRATAVKGGWGPLESGGYLVRQIGLLTRLDGRQVAFALNTYAPGASLDSGIAVLNQVGGWIADNLAKMPGGRCR